MSRELALGRPGLRVRIIRKVRAYAGPADISQAHRYYAFTDLAEVSSAWLHTTEGPGLGAAEACHTRCEIVDATDRPLAHVAYNGRVFACSPEGDRPWAGAVRPAPLPRRSERYHTSTHW